MTQLYKIVATVKSALEAGGAAADAVASPATAPLPVATVAHRAELATRFARELEAVAGRFLGIATPAEVIPRCVALAREIGARSAAIGGAGVAASSAAALAAALEDAGCAMFRTAPVSSGAERALMRERIARCDLGIAEAACAIAATGTVGVVADEAHPGALSLLPTASLVIVPIDRLFADLASALDAIAPAIRERRRVSLITGPSRTADIEKRIVLGVHGPKSLHAILVWPRDE